MDDATATSEPDPPGADWEALIAQMTPRQRVSFAWALLSVMPAIEPPTASFIRGITL